MRERVRQGNVGPRRELRGAARRTVRSNRFAEEQQTTSDILHDARVIARSSVGVGVGVPWRLGLYSVDIIPFDEYQIDVASVGRVAAHPAVNPVPSETERSARCLISISIE